MNIDRMGVHDLTREQLIAEERRIAKIIDTEDRKPARDGETNLPWFQERLEKIRARMDRLGIAHG